MGKILIVYNDMDMGGTGVTLLSLTENLLEKGFQVDLLLWEQKGCLLERLPKKVNVIDNTLLTPLRQGLKQRIKKDLKRLRFVKVIKALSGKINHAYRADLFNEQFKEIPILKGYDYAISYSVYFPLLNRFVADNVEAERKYGWIHNPFVYNRKEIRNLDDPARYMDKKRALKYLLKFDKLVAVSYGVLGNIRNAFPQLGSKLVVAYNFLNSDEILTKSIATSAWESDKLKILTIGRMAVQKGMDIIPAAANHLKQKGINFEWRIIGGGENEEYLALVKKKIAAYGLENDVVLIGPMNNPFPYLRSCDIYCQPSRYEAYCTTINEARLLKKAIVATSFEGIDEQVDNDINGIIVPFDAERIAEALTRLSDPSLRTALSEATVYPNAAETENAAVKDKLFERV